MTDYNLDFEHTAESVLKITTFLKGLGVEKAVLKVLPRNANDKNQIYFASHYTPLHSMFDLTLAERGLSTSEKERSRPGSAIPEAVFKNFYWVKPDGDQIRARNVKAIVYTQYPESRLSGFQTVNNTMPQSLSVGFTKDRPDCKRLLVLGRLPNGACLAMVYIDISDALETEIQQLNSFEGSRVCKVIVVEQGYAEKLAGQLSKIVSRELKGCRLNAYGDTIPFTGTQVCGYTLEHALDIRPNSDMDGDLYGIELKTHTQPKVTLFTPEPDFGLYAEGFDKFMYKYGYKNGEEWRLTGIHRANIRASRSGLTLKVREYKVIELGKGKFDWERDAQGCKVAYTYDPETQLTPKMEEVEVVLVDDENNIAAGWSLSRLMNNWGAKHNEAVYISASKSANSNIDQAAEGYAYEVTFEPKVIWCKQTSAEKLLQAINDGLIFLDPAPKFVPTDPSKNKRRSQWRVNNIAKTVETLYEQVEFRDLS